MRWPHCRRFLLQGISTVQAQSAGILQGFTGLSNQLRITIRQNEHLVGIPINCVVQAFNAVLEDFCKYVRTKRGGYYGGRLGYQASASGHGIVHTEVSRHFWRIDSTRLQRGLYCIFTSRGLIFGTSSPSFRATTAATAAPEAPTDQSTCFNSGFKWCVGGASPYERYQSNRYGSRPQLGRHATSPRHLMRYFRSFSLLFFRFAIMSLRGCLLVGERV